MATLAILWLLYPPPNELWDACRRFPSLDFARATIDFSCAFEASLSARRAERPRLYFEYTEAIAEVKRRRAIWQDLAWVQSDVFCRQARMDSLRDLERELPPSDFWGGRLPEPVPLWCCSCPSD